jgi:hypothetical protein
MGRLPSVRSATSIVHKPLAHRYVVCGIYMALNCTTARTHAHTHMGTKQLFPRSRFSQDSNIWTFAL